MSNADHTCYMGSDSLHIKPIMVKAEFSVSQQSGGRVRWDQEMPAWGVMIWTQYNKYVYHKGV